ncbi:MAG: nuclear transport factor 2 family protein [Acidimicrobiales bacterium]|nr:nuclear transport factor 2 family protein [Acidimicrobiales bacterium]
MALPVEDVLAIQTLLAQYNHLIDGGDGDGWAALFVADGSLDVGMGEPTVGTDALAAFAKGTVEMVPGIRHMITNVVVDGDGDSATAAAYLQVWQAKAPASDSVQILSGVYRDTLRRDGGQWKFVTRRMLPDTGGALAAG